LAIIETPIIGVDSRTNITALVQSTIRSCCDHNSSYHTGNHTGRTLWKVMYTPVSVNSQNEPEDGIHT